MTRRHRDIAYIACRRYDDASNFGVRAAIHSPIAHDAPVHGVDRAPRLMPAIRRSPKRHRQSSPHFEPRAHGDIAYQKSGIAIIAIRSGPPDAFRNARRRLPITHHRL